jgi:hypothetical protein
MAKVNIQESLDSYDISRAESVRYTNIKGKDSEFS